MIRPFFSILVTEAMLLGLTCPSLARAQDPPTATPIQHVVIIFGENISFDHYFGTYPKAANPPGQPHFQALPNTPAVNGLTQKLLTKNPNLNPANGAGAANPFRLDRTQALTADQNHDYGPEQASFDHGKMDLFPVSTGSAGPPPSYYPKVVSTTGLVMGYYDGNTVTAMWNYAQHYTLNQNSYNTQFGPSTPGAINLISGQTNGVTATLNGPSSDVVSDGSGGFTVIGDPDPIGDVCSSKTRFQVTMGGRNIGDLLNQASISWGWFNGGFDLTATNPNGTSGCKRSTVSPITHLTEGDYVPHHQPFQYYPSTANPSHARPTNVASIGLQGDAANHQYDLHDWFDALKAGNLPAVSFLKAQSYQDGHPSNSNPLDEQAFVVEVSNALQKSAFWGSTAIVIAYDDSDGWYDHVMSPTVNASFSTQDSLTGPNACGVKGKTPQFHGVFTANGVDGRCGYGVRTPLLVISPWAKHNFVDKTLTDQTSVTRFVEDNWLGGKLTGGTLMGGKHIGQGSLDQRAGSMAGMFDFTQTRDLTPYLLNPISGEPQ
jgi:phospholipase C